uniref:Putative secreted peptide n=1 Tax=Anopheles braziliensis TaxID=58242 RepID=A0A2M3ZXM2_9DIPT
MHFCLFYFYHPLSFIPLVNLFRDGHPKYYFGGLSTMCDVCYVILVNHFHFLPSVTRCSFNISYATLFAFQ